MEERSETTRESARRSGQIEDTTSPGLEPGAAGSHDERDPKQQHTGDLREKGTLKGD